MPSSAGCCLGLLVTTLGPAIVLAQPGLKPAAEPGNVRPVAKYESSFSHYRPFREQELRSWTEVNKEVADNSMGHAMGTMKGMAGHSGHGTGAQGAPGPAGAPAHDMAAMKDKPVHKSGPGHVAMKGAAAGVLRTAMERSVKRQAHKVQVPELEDPEKVHAGLAAFHETCVICHGAPGEERTQLSKGLYPKAPDLAQAARAWTPAELFVITKGGIKMTGMPAWGPTHSDEQLWQIVAFLRLLPTMPQAEYRGAIAYHEASSAGGRPGANASHPH